jgi:hypothetical protein
MRVLLLSTYSSSGTDTGGVVRLRAIRDALSSSGAITRVLVVVPPGTAPSRQGADEAVIAMTPGSLSAQDLSAVGYLDVLTGLRSVADPATVSAVLSAAVEFRPTAVVLEQPFLVGLAEQIQDRTNAKLIYSAANLEAVLKQQLKQLVPVHYRHEEDLIAETLAMEQRAVRGANLTISISSEMTPTLTAWGAKTVLVFGNGARERGQQSTVARQLANYVQTTDVTAFGFFGSAYWPNVEGLASVMDPSLAFLPPMAKLLMTGKLYEDVRKHPRFLRCQSLNESRMVGFGYLPADEYDALVGACDALVIPVFVGSGSPLKTADALASGRPVLLSEAMATGYADVLAECPDGVAIVRDARDFRTAWRDWAYLGRRGLAELTGQAASRARLLTWAHRLGGLGRAVEAA